MISILRKVEELGLNASAGNTRNSHDALGTKLNSGKKKAILRDYPENVNFMNEILARPVFEKKYLRKPHDKHIVPAK